MKSIFNAKYIRIFNLFCVILLVIFSSCNKKSNKSVNSKLYNPSLPVSISGFFPEKGGQGQQLVIYGDNFGNDTSIVEVFIGGKKAPVIGVHNNAIYCLVPGQAYKGNIDVEVGSGESKKNAVSKNNFSYTRKFIVTTLLGKTDQRGNYVVKNGPFNDCGGIYMPSWLEFDPKDSSHLYIGERGGGNIRLINFKDSTVTTPIPASLGGWSNIRTIDFTLNGQYMIVDNDQRNINGTAVSILSRAANFQDPKVLVSYENVNGASIHPKTGELYFNSFDLGQFFRFDMNKYLKYGATGPNGVSPKDFTELFKVQDVGWAYQIDMCPNGNYAYIIVNNQNYILRTDYNWTTKTFTQPYIICGKPRVAGWKDGVGANARLNNPFEGVFVKNPAYAGQKNQYDFYFTERRNNDIRILTPDGRVTTFAGRGSPNLNSGTAGYVNGGLRTQARFNGPQGLAYDRRTKTFYVGDCGNHVIRKIALEGK